jgi:phosphoenolpyruvate-protein kinase (PTS system EI component)
VRLGVDELSISPVLVPEIKTIIRSISLEEAQQLSKRALASGTQEEVLDILKKSLEEKASGFFIM